jgi:outer membrane protein assembly factor BamB
MPLPFVFRLSSFVVVPLLLTACSRPPAPAPRTPRQPRPPTGTFLAQGAGGPLHNVAPPIMEPPMKVRWTYQTKEGMDASPLIDSDTVYIADNSGDLAALQLADGKKRWIFHTEGLFSNATPLLAGGRVYIGDLAGVFFAIDAKTGDKLWSHDTGNPIHGSANIYPSDADDAAPPDSRPTVQPSPRVLFGNDTGQMVCLDAVTGKPLWNPIPSAEGRINAAPAIHRDRAFFTSCDARLRALGLADGKQVFVTDLRNLAPGAACASDTTLFVGTDQGHVLALSQADGTRLWSFDKIADNAMVMASPALSGDTLVVAARDRHVYALNIADGRVKWSFATGGDIDASPVISDGRIYVASKDRRLYVLSLADGKQFGPNGGWTFETARPVTAGVAIAQGVLVLGDNGGTVYCLEPEP